VPNNSIKNNTVNILNDKVVTYAEVFEMIKGVCECEDKKYPKPKMERNMLFVKHIYPLFKTYLLNNGFTLSKNEEDFVAKVA